MATPSWQPGRLYPPGSLVVPRTAAGSSAQAIANPSFEDGDAGWSFGANWEVVEGSAYVGGRFLRYTGNGQETANEAVAHDVVAGQRISAWAFTRMQGGQDNQGCAMLLAWYTDADVLVSITAGPTIPETRGAWVRMSVSGTAPAAAKKVRVAYSATNNTGGWPDARVDIDGAGWNYVPPVAANLQYKAVQPATGYSDTDEPVWPGTLGQQVIDHEVIWEAVSLTRVVWQARPLLRSGADEPTWPTAPGAFVADGTISWEAVSRRIEDANCPDSTVTAIIASKVFKADRDIVRFSATANPLDWTTAEDAGYLPTGLQQANANDMAVLQPYRGNLAAFNASSFQMWQVDPDPQLMALLDQMDGVGSTWQRAAQAVGDELFYLSQLGVRTVGIANAAENLSAGDVGMPIDPVVQEAMVAAVADGVDPLGTYYPSAGQYWLAFPQPNADGGARTVVFVYSMTRAGKVGAWSRYIFPFLIEAFAQLGNDLYIRHGDTIGRVSEQVAHDEVDGEPLPFPGVVHWPWLDFGNPGQTKMLEGFDYVGNGQGPAISFGYDQRSLAAFTEPYALPADTLPGGVIPMPLSAPTLSVKLNFEGGQRWQVQAVMLLVHATGGGP